MRLATQISALSHPNITTCGYSRIGVCDLVEVPASSIIHIFTPIQRNAIATHFIRLASYDYLLGSAKNLLLRI
jgi:hypothetical protein